MNSEGWRTRRFREEQYFADIREILRRAFSGQRLTLLTQSEFIRKWSWQAAERMVTGLMVDNARTWRAAARESMRGRQIYEALRAELSGSVGTRAWELVRANASLISSLPLEIAERVNAKIAEHALEGERAEFYSDRWASQLSRSRARLIARTETSKATTALTQARAEELDIDWWVWQTSQDQRVRLSHRKMQGVLCSWHDLPSPELLVGEKSYGHYAAGNIFNCRCYPEPVLYLDQVTWPHRVYLGGSVRYMTLNQFRNTVRRQIPQLEKAAA